MTLTRKSVALFIVLALLIGGYAAATTAAANQAGENASAAQVKTVKFDVAEDATRFVFDEKPVDEDGLPAYGNSFVTQGYIYPHGTLDDTNGVKPNGEPQFPKKVIGEWTCRGWFVGEGASTESGPWVSTTQLYDLGDKPGEVTLVTDGSEIADVGVPSKRAITGGTGPYREAAGEGSQKLLGFNESEGVNLRFELKVSTH
jgi:hypothetical protein